MGKIFVEYEIKNAEELKLIFKGELAKKISFVGRAEKFKGYSKGAK